MEYVAYFTIIAVTLLLCWLVDTLCKRLRARKDVRNRVKPQTRSAAFGVILCFLSIVFALNFLKVWYAVLAAVFLLAMGILLIVVYCRTTISYDAEEFTYQTPFHRAKTYRYADITGQMAVLARSGVNTMLMVGDAEIHLYESMTNVNDFLKTAYRGWLAATGKTEEECPPVNPSYLVWFPEPENGG